MYKFVLENKRGNRLTFNEIGGDFTITEINGLSPAEATINTSDGAYIDGKLFNSSKVNMRTIQIAFAIENNAAASRIAVYKVLKSKQWIRAYYTNEYRDVYIDGYVKSIGISQFAMKQIVTVTIECPSPFWKSSEVMSDELSTVLDAFHFPFMSTEEPELVFGYLDPVANVEITNQGDLETGLIIELYANSTVSNPRIYDYVTGDYIALDFTMQEADLITIDTRAGEKTITLTRNAVRTNIFNALVRGSTWLQLDFNGGVYAYEVGSGNAGDLVVTINHTNIFEGV